MVGSSARPEFGRLGHRARTRLARERHTWSDSLGLTNERFPTASAKHKTNYVWAEDDRDRAVRTTCREIAPSLYLNSSSLSSGITCDITCDDDIDPTRHT